MTATQQTPTIRAAIYARVSTTSQVDGTSLDEQQALCKDTILAKGWEVGGVYVDEGLSGTSRERPEWSRMLADCKSGDLQAVVVAKLDRFARKAADAITETDRFSELGVTLVVVKEQIDMSTPGGRMMRTMLAGVAEMERDMIVERTVSGQRAKAQNGTWPGGTPPYGWKLQGKGRTAEPVPDLEEREVIALVYELLVRKRLNAQQATDRLNDLGLKPRKVARWNPDVLRRMITNPTLYTGTVLWGAAETGSLYKRSHHTRLDRNGQPVYGTPIELTLPEPPLTRTQHRTVRRVIERRSTRNTASAPQTQLMSTRLVGACGKHYIGVSLANKDYDVYRCSGRRHTNGPEKCTCKQVRAQTLDARVWGEIARLLGDPSRLEAMARRWLELPDESSLDDVAPIITKLDREIERKSRALSRARDDMYEADDPSEHTERIERFSVELAGLKQRMSGYAAMVSDAAAKQERMTDLVRLAERARGRLETLPVAARREIVEILDIRVSMIGDVVICQPDRVSEPEGIRITGVIDPRLFDDGSDGKRGGDAGPLSDFPTPGNSRHGGHRDDGVLGSRRTGFATQTAANAFQHDVVLPYFFPV